MLLYLYKIWYLILLWLYTHNQYKCDLRLKPPECDVSIDTSICINNGQKILLPSAKPYGISTHITFDSLMPVDSTGNRNHAHGKFFASSGFGGIGNSALFRQNYIYIPHSDEYFKSVDFSYTFFIYLLQDEISRYKKMKSEH
ncbi:hypothetical protein PFDG_02158 [Plasmodium falciparum Dd2]|uniref:Uncharacterized protein n=1 Tax=Plasmodium falciparum (isolate Dd2) TaxID=57267 RepID=A0A0L7M112_PLAF4|nr:hypothetical protein PFDG_02158 [Plasmodium falciparum Dd2]